MTVIMRKPLKQRGRTSKPRWTPPEDQQREIIRVLLNLKHFHEIHYNSRLERLYVKRNVFGELEDLSWKDAKAMVEFAATVFAPEILRKPVSSETSGVQPANAAAK